MQNFAYKLELPTQTTSDDFDRCAACGAELCGPDAQACSWQAWGTFWQVLGMSNVELVCGNCGELLQDFLAKHK